MSRVSSSSNLFFRRIASGESVPTTPAEALRRLDLRGPAGEPFGEVVNLSAGELVTAIRTIDDERLALEDNYAAGTTADTALTKIAEKLGEAEALVAANGKSGVGRRTRRQNQAKVDALLADVEQLAEEARAPQRLGSVRLFDGNAVLHAGKPSVQRPTLALPALTLRTLGRVTGRGGTFSLKDVARRGALDTSQDRATIPDDARRAIKEATETVAALKTSIQDYQRDTLIPRLGDAATAMEGLYTSAATTTIANAADARLTAAQLRRMTLDTATIATAVGADGWDRERTLALLA